MGDESLPVAPDTQIRRIIDLATLTECIEDGSMTLPVRKVYSELKHIDEVDSATSALFRQHAQEVLAETEISLARRQVIAKRLMQANQFLGMQTVNSGDSY
jgi:hypothetical protein